MQNLRFMVFAVEFLVDAKTRMPSYNATVCTSLDGGVVVD